MATAMDGQDDSTFEYDEIDLQRVHSDVELDNSISAIRQVLRDPQRYKVDPIAYKSKLAGCLFTKYNDTGKLEFLNEAILLGKGILNADTVKPSFQADLGVFLCLRYKATGNGADLDKAFRNLKEAVDATAQHDAHLAQRLGEYSNCLNIKFGVTGADSDKQDAISYARKALALTNENDEPSRAIRLSNLASIIYGSFVSPSELDEAISHAQEARKLFDKLHPPISGSIRANNYNNLGNMLVSRFELLMTREDLDNAIVFMQDAVECASVDKPTYLYNLARFLRARYTRMSNEDDPANDRRCDLESSIHCLQEAIALLPSRHVNLPELRNVLANQLRTKHEAGLDDRLNDLGEAISIGRQLVQITSIRRPSYQNNLALSLLEQYKSLHEAGDLQEAIETLIDAVDITSQENPELPRFLYNLATCYTYSYALENIDAHSAKAAECFEMAATLPISTPLQRIDSAYRAGLVLTESKQCDRAFAVLSAAMDDVPRVCPRALAREDQQFVLGQLSGLSALAASAALASETSEKSATTAIKILEIGRGVMSSYIYNSRSDVSDLARYCPHLYSEYEHHREELSKEIKVSSTSPSSGGSFVDLVAKRRADLQRLEDVEREIRRLDEFSTFQLPMQAGDIMRLAERGPIVAFNVSLERSDAIIITEKDIRSVRLYDLMHAEVSEFVNLMGGDMTKGLGQLLISDKASTLQQILTRLWVAAVRPVLLALKLITDHPKGTQLPRIWWIASGLMGLLPIHAAGDHSRPGSTENTRSYVVSSYSPTIAALAHSRKKSQRSLGKPYSSL